jgi:O-antigen ligase
MSSHHRSSAPPTSFVQNIRLIQALGALACLPFLILSDYFSNGIIVTALVSIGLLGVLGAAVAGRPVVRTPLDLPVGLLLALTPLNYLISADRALSLPHVTKTVAGIVIFYAIVGLLIETRWFRLAGWAICLIGLALVPYVIFGTHWTGAEKLSWIPTTISKNLPQHFQAFWKPSDYKGFNINLAGGTLAMFTPVPLAFALFADSKKTGLQDHAASLILRLAAGLAAALIGGMMLLTQSRGAILAVATAVGVMLAARDWRWLIVAALAVAATVMLLQADVLSSPVPLDIESDAALAVDSAQRRLALYARAIYIIQDFPYTGAGMGLVNDLLSHRYPLFGSPMPTKVGHLHNFFLHAGAEMGIPGLIGLTAFLLGLLVLIWRAVRSAPNKEITDPGSRDLLPGEPLTLGMLGVVVVICGHGLTETIAYSPQANSIIWGFFGVATAIGMLTRSMKA